MNRLVKLKGNFQKLSNSIFCWLPCSTSRNFLFRKGYTVLIKNVATINSQVVLNTSASFPDNALDDAIKRLEVHHVYVARVCGYCTQLAVPNSSSNTNCKGFNSGLVYLKAWYFNAVVGLTICYHYQHPLFSAASKQLSNYKPQGFSSFS